MPYADQISPAVERIPLSLILISILAGLAMLRLFGAVSRPDAIRAAKRRMQARLLELRLFGDEPALVWRAQAGLLTANLLYLRVMLIPIAVVAVPTLLVFPHLDAIYGRAPLPVGAATMLTLHLRAPFGGSLPQPRIVAPSGLRVETAAVRVPAEREISWELSADGPVSQPVRIEFGGMAVSKVVRTIHAGGYLAQSATASPLGWLVNPGEALIGGASVDWIRVEYRRMRYSLGEWELPWEAWFLVISMVAAVAGKIYWRVVF